MHHQLVEDKLVGDAALLSARKFAYAGLFCPISGKALLNRPKSAAAIVSQFSHLRSLVVATWLHYPLRFGLATRNELAPLLSSHASAIIDDLTSIHLSVDHQQQDLTHPLGDIEALSDESQLIVLADLYYLLDIRLAFQTDDRFDYAKWLAQQLPRFSAQNEHLLKRLSRLIDSVTTNQRAW